MSFNSAFYETKGTIIRIKLHMRSGNIQTINPIMYGASGWIRKIGLKNDLIDFKSPLSEFHSNILVFLNDDAEQVYALRLELREQIIGITPLVIYPDGSTWEGLIGTNVSEVDAMIWSPGLAAKLKGVSLASPWSEGQDWREVPTSLLISTTGATFSCSRIEHSCCEPCK